MESPKTRSPKALRQSTLQESLLADGKTVKIPLTRGMFAFIDIEDFSLISGRKWNAWKDKHDHTYATGAIKREGKFKFISMHRMIMGADDPREIDHKDRDGTNNRRENLRFCGKPQQQMNRKLESRSTTNLKGVSFKKSNRNYTASIRINGKSKHIGSFKTAIEAAIAYDAAAVKYFGEFARLNFPLVSGD